MRNKQLYRKLKKKYGKHKADFIMAGRRRKNRKNQTQLIQKVNHAFKSFADALGKIVSEYNKPNKVDSDWNAHLEMDSIK